MDSQTVFQKSFGFLGNKPVIVETSSAQLTSDAGLIPIREFDEAFHFSLDFANALHDPRDQRFTKHTFLEMTRARLFGILADYEDQNDHDQLRHDPIFKLIAAGTLEKTLASQPTHSRFENDIDIASLNRLRDLFIQQFIDAFDSPPDRLTLDIDTFDDPAHGAQQLVLFHGKYGQYQYQPRVITCAQNDMTVMLCLLFGSAHAGLGAADDITFLVNRLRETWPDVDIELRADSAFATPEILDQCEKLRIWYTIGYAMNKVLLRQSDETMDEVLAAYQSNGEPQRDFVVAADYKASTWPHARLTIIKCEANAEGTNRRAYVTNRRGGEAVPAGVYADYRDHGECENRNKELKCGMSADRLSDHRYMANLFRLYLHAEAQNLLIRIRREVAAPPAEPADEPVPVEAWTGKRKKDRSNLRRREDPLGEGHAATWRSRLIKVSAEVVERSRCIRVKLSGSWPYLKHFMSVGLSSIRLLEVCREGACDNLAFMTLWFGHGGKGAYRLPLANRRDCLQKSCAIPASPFAKLL